MRILFLSPRQSWPAVSGAKLRDYYFARALGASSRLTYAYFRDARTPAPEFPFCERVEALPAPQMYTPGKIVRGIFGRWPLPVVNYTSETMSRAVEALEGPFDFVHLDSIHMTAYAPLARGARAVYNWHNIESELMRRYAESAPTPAHRAYGTFTARRLAALEKDLLRNAFGHLVCSERERRQLLALAPQARIAVVENGVDTGAFKAKPGGAGRKRLVFVGSMNYHANIDAAVWFTRNIWPAVRERFPQWTLTLVGAQPAPAVLALRGDSVEVTGTVPSVAPYYEDAAAAVVPLRTGGGTRLKILEAMAAGVPVVSTALGAEGLDVSPGKDILMAEADPENWLAALGELAGSEERWRQLAQAGRTLVESRYDWDVLGKKLVQIYRVWLETA